MQQEPSDTVIAFSLSLSLAFVVLYAYIFRFQGRGAMERFQDPEEDAVVRAAAEQV